MLITKSIRKYTEQQTSQEQIDTNMKSAIFVPSALNKQSREIRIIQNPKILVEINQWFLNFAEGKEMQGSATKYNEPEFSIQDEFHFLLKKE